MSRPLATRPAERVIERYLSTLLDEVEAYRPPPAPTVAEALPADPAPATLPPAGACRETAAAAGTKETGVPDWANGTFQCLLFRLRGMRLALPLSALDSILKWDGRATRIPGQPSWHRGVILYRGNRLVVVDTARLIMPERLPPATAAVPRNGHLLIVGDGRWGLACDSLQRPVSLRADAVHWRRGGGRAPWVAGTIRERLCALLDMEQLLRLFDPVAG